MKKYITIYLFLLFSDVFGEECKFPEVEKPDGECEDCNQWKWKSDECEMSKTNFDECEKSEYCNPTKADAIKCEDPEVNDEWSCIPKIAKCSEVLGYDPTNEDDSVSPIIDCNFVNKDGTDRFDDKTDKKYESIACSPNQTVVGGATFPTTLDFEKLPCELKCCMLETCPSDYPYPLKGGEYMCCKKKCTKPETGKMDCDEKDCKDCVENATAGKEPLCQMHPGFTKRSGTWYIIIAAIVLGLVALTLLILCCYVIPCVINGPPIV